MTGDAQISFLARLYRSDRGETLRYVAELSQLGPKLYDSMANYTAREKDRLMFAVALALQFEVYVLDGDLPNIQPSLATIYRQAWEDRLKTSRVLIAASKPPRLADHCELAVMLDAGQLGPALPMQRATRLFREKMRLIRVAKQK